MQGESGSAAKQSPELTSSSPGAFLCSGYSRYGPNLLSGAEEGPRDPRLMGKISAPLFSMPGARRTSLAVKRMSMTRKECNLRCQAAWKEARRREEERLNGKVSRRPVDRPPKSQKSVGSRYRRTLHVDLALVTLSCVKPMLRLNHAVLHELIRDIPRRPW